jgi:hypothetical protein
VPAVAEAPLPEAAPCAGFSAHEAAERRTAQDGS